MSDGDQGQKSHPPLGSGEHFMGACRGARRWTARGLEARLFNLVLCTEAWSFFPATCSFRLTDSCNHDRRFAWYLTLWA